PARKPDRVRIAKANQLEACSFERRAQCSLRIAAVVAELCIERAVRHLQRRYEDDNMAARDKDVLERSEGVHVFFDVFQHVDEKDGLEPVARELRGFAFLEVAG